MKPSSTPHSLVILSTLWSAFPLIAICKKALEKERLLYKHCLLVFNNERFFSYTKILIKY